MPYAREGLLSIRRWDAESLREGDRVKQKQSAHDAVSSYLVSLSGLTAAKKYRVRDLANTAYPVMRHLSVIEGY